MTSKSEMRRKAVQTEDHLTLCSEKRLRELLEAEKQLALAEKVIEAAKAYGEAASAACRADLAWQEALNGGEKLDRYNKLVQDAYAVSSVAGAALDHALAEYDAARKP